MKPQYLTRTTAQGKTDEPPVLNDDDDGYFASVPFRIFEGSEAPILGLDWGGQYFLLSAGVDRVVRLWHIARVSEVVAHCQGKCDGGDAVKL